MRSAISFAVLFFSASMGLAACANKPCHEVQVPQGMKTAQNETQAASQATAPAAPEAKSSVKAIKGKPMSFPLTGNAKIFKYDGSRQCGQGETIPLETAAKELEGIQIVSQSKMSDGLMHTQNCGGSTGQANVFEIQTKDLQKAFKKGFKVWKF